MAKKMPLDRLRQISGARRPPVFLQRDSDGDENRVVRALRPKPEESSED